MKKYIIPMILTAFLPFLSSCKKDFLNVIPFGQRVATTTADYDQLMNSVAFYNYNAGGWDIPAIMGDEVSLEGSNIAYGTPQQSKAFQWLPDIYLQSDIAYDVQANAKNLYEVNKIIAEVGQSTEGTDGQKASLAAEAMATRAGIYLQWISYYGKPYLASSAATDPGFPIITKADATLTNLSRNSVQEVYDLIIKDLTTAIPSLPVKASIQTRMSKPAAESLLGRAYLYMARYKDGATVLQAALNDISAAGANQLYDYNVTLGPGGAWLSGSPYVGPNGPGTNQNDLTEAVISKTWVNSLFYTPGTALTSQAAALFGAADMRLNLYTKDYADGSPNPAMRLTKFGVYYSRFGVQLPDVYLMSAECKARINNLTGAKTDVETLRKSRMPSADATVPANIANDQTALIKFIIDERTREFAGEGYRWFDMRRLSVDPLIGLAQPVTHTIYNADNTTTVYTLDIKRLTLQFPRTY